MQFPCVIYKAKLIGEGGYAEVYKGQLENGQFVAVKRLTRGSQEEMTADFLSELGINIHVDHPNVAKVIGYGVEGGMHLVLELSPHGSLSTILYGLFYMKKLFNFKILILVFQTLFSVPFFFIYIYIQARGKNWIGASDIIFV